MVAAHRVERKTLFEPRLHYAESVHEAPDAHYLPEDLRGYDPLHPQGMDFRSILRKIWGGIVAVTADASDVLDSFVHSIAHDKRESFVPWWFRSMAVLQGSAPSLFSRGLTWFSGRFGARRA